MAPAASLASATISLRACLANSTIPRSFEWVQSSVWRDAHENVFWLVVSGRFLWDYAGANDSRPKGRGFQCADRSLRQALRTVELEDRSSGLRPFPNLILA